MEIPLYIFPIVFIVAFVVGFSLAYFFMWLMDAEDEDQNDDDERPCLRPVRNYPH